MKNFMISTSNEFLQRYAFIWYVVVYFAVDCDGFHSYSISGLVTAINNHKLDPSGVYFALEAMKHRTPREAQAIFVEYKMAPSQIDAVLRELNIGSFEVYYKLKKWIGAIADDRSDNPSFDKLSLFEAFRAMQLQSYTPDQVDEEMNILMSREPAQTEPSTKAINLYRVIENFFDKDNFYLSWKREHPEAFKALKEIYDKNDLWKPIPSVTYFTRKSKLMKLKLPKRIPRRTTVYTSTASTQREAHTHVEAGYCNDVGHSNIPTDAPGPSSVSASVPPTLAPIFLGTMQSHNIPPGLTVVDPQTTEVNNQSSRIPSHVAAQDQFDLYDPRFDDLTRYDQLHDEMHVYDKLQDETGDAPTKTIQHVKRFYDRKENIVIECKNTIEHHLVDNGSYRKVHKDVNKFDPNTEPGRKYLEMRSIRPKIQK